MFTYVQAFLLSVALAAPASLATAAMQGKDVGRRGTHWGETRGLGMQER